MAVESLQDLANEIVLNGVSINAINYLYIALVAFLSSALGTFTSSYFKKQGEEKSLKASFNDVINRLKKTTKLTEDIKSEVGRDAMKHQIKFSKLYEKRIDTIEGLYHRLEKMEQKGKECIYFSSPSQEMGEKLQDAQELINDFVSFSKLNKFWVDKELFDQIEEIALSIDHAVHEAAFNSGVDPENFAQFQDAIKKRSACVESITKEIPDAKAALVNSIRKTLDPNEN